jgi:dephospho-CoA kinase
VGLTGGIGSGKSAAGAALAELGWLCVDTDALVHEIYEDKTVRAAVRERWGSAVFDAAGAVDRAVLGEKVFGDAEELAALERIVHPRVRARWRELILREPDRHAVVEIPLLFEKRLEKQFDFSVCIYVSGSVQLQRLASRGMDEASARARIARQMPISQKARLADFVFLNDGSQEFLTEQVAAWCARLRLLS